MLRNRAVDVVEICNICARKAIIKGANRIINSDEMCRSYSDLNFGVTFLEHSVVVLISQLPKLCVKISILMHRLMWVRSFTTRLTSVTFAEDKVLIFLIIRKMLK